ncbi:uncharacterized protein LOC120257485 [Dioscorea cayenensis subsp. rotundata]|uniref:Uncharacterized protein LOC120257485 n=1 Tax=Dioscorea cayennensis subsp. rotundata TaxID=55577 RepID=A0AB40B0W9_DIOCR|nr:uncharacterized protein LOC120257485 [Dioscorea cayenensis subsp. rotundata]
MASNECHWSTRKKTPKAAGIYEINDNTALAAKVEALTKRFNQFVLGTSSNSGAVLSCKTCGAGHATIQCPISIATDAPVETVDYVGGASRGPGNPYGNTYNPGWRNHPNFSWGQQQQHQPPQSQGPLHQPPQQPEKKFTTEDVLARFMINTEAKFVNINNQFAEVNTVLRNEKASIQSLENQVGQLARANSERPPSSLPSNTENNPREHLKAVTLRSGKQVEARAEEGSSTKHNGVAIQEDPKPSESDVEGVKEKQDEGTIQLPTPRILEYKPVIPYPARLRQDKDEAQFKKFLNRKLPEKLNDPGSFIIPCVIGEDMQEKALADSGASINEVLAINPLDEFLEGMDSDEYKLNNPPPTQVKHVGYVGTFPWPNNKKKSTTRKIWCKRDKKKKLGMNCTLSPPWEIDRLFFEGKEIEVLIVDRRTLNSLIEGAL